MRSHHVPDVLLRIGKRTEPFVQLEECARSFSAGMPRANIASFNFSAVTSAMPPIAVADDENFLHAQRVHGHDQAADDATPRLRTVCYPAFLSTWASPRLMPMAGSSSSTGRESMQVKIPIFVRGFRNGFLPQRGSRWSTKNAPVLPAKFRPTAAYGKTPASLREIPVAGRLQPLVKPPRRCLRATQAPWRCPWPAPARRLNRLCAAQVPSAPRDSDDYHQNTGYGRLSAFQYVARLFITTGEQNGDESAQTVPAGTPMSSFRFDRAPVSARWRPPGDGSFL